MRIGLPRNAQLWLPGYLGGRLRRRERTREQTVHVLFCIADHFEPDHGRATLDQERERVSRWIREYPSLGSIRDADGNPPRHTFFFPAEAYRAEHLDQLAALCAGGFGEVEVHLHHGHDTSHTLRNTLQSFARTLASQHGLLSVSADGGIHYGFIHGNWALDNGALDDSLCGVNDELTVLCETGCYADFTMPAVPSPAQSRIVNRIYYAHDDQQRPRSYDRGTSMEVGRPQPPDSLLLIEGPLSVWWSGKSPRIGLRIDSGTLDSSPGNLPTVERFARWVDAGISVVGRPEWVFVKVHTHGAPDRNAFMLLGEHMKTFHEHVGTEFNDGVRFQLHYVTAREMFNIAKAAEAGHSGNPGLYRDFLLRPITRESGGA